MISDVRKNSKKSAYEEFRSKRPTLKRSMSQSMIEINNDAAVEDIGNANCSQLDFLQTELNSILRSRSNSRMTQSVVLSDDQHFVNSSKACINEKCLQLEEDFSSKRHSLPSATQAKNTLYTGVGMLNTTFEPIEETSVQNEEDFEKSPKKNSLTLGTKKTVQNNTKSTERKGNKQPLTKFDVKNSISQLNDMKHKLESKQNSKKTNNLTEGVFNRLSARTSNDRRVKNSTSESDPFGKSSNLIDKKKPFIKEPTTPTPKQRKDFQKNLKIKSKTQLHKQIVQQEKDILKSETQDVQIPTHMISLQEKQKLYKRLDAIKQSISNTEISVSSLGEINSLMQALQKCIH